jgi:hypothetical protein
VQEHERAAVAVAGQVGDLDVEPVDGGQRRQAAAASGTRMPRPRTRPSSSIKRSW